MKVVFVNPPNPYAIEPAMNPPLGICYIASYLQERGIEDITLIDFNLFDYDFYKSEYLDEIPLDADVYGIYCMTPQYRWMQGIVEYLDACCLDAKIIVGGPHATTMPLEVYNDCLVDYVIQGDGEEAFYQLITSKGKFNVKKRWIVDDLDSLPFPNRDLKGAPINNYKRTIEGNKAIHLVTLRGCPFSCAFCDKNSVGRQVRFRSVENVMQEIDDLMSKYSWATSYVIYDDIFTMIPDRVFQFCTEFKRREIKWRCWSRADLVSKVMLAKMKDAGLSSITFGIESGDDNVLRRANKRTTAEDNKNALLMTKELGIPVRCSLMYGLPGENRQSIDNTIEMIAKTKPDEWNLAILAPIPGSSIWNKPRLYGIEFSKKWLKEQYYEPCNRFGGSGIGSIWAKNVEMTRQEYMDNLNYFVSELERVCPRNKIQDTIQEIDIAKAI